MIKPKALTRLMRSKLVNYHQFHVLLTLDTEEWMDYSQLNKETNLTMAILRGPRGMREIHKAGLVERNVPIRNNHKYQKVFWRLSKDGAALIQSLFREEVAS